MSSDQTRAGLIRNNNPTHVKHNGLNIILMFVHKFVISFISHVVVSWSFIFREEKIKIVSREDISVL